MPKRAVPHGDTHSTVWKCQRLWGILDTSVSTHASQQDTMTRQQSYHAGLVGFGRVVLPFDLQGLIIARIEFLILVDGPHRMLLTDRLWVKLQKNVGPVMTKINEDAIQNKESD